MPGKPMTKLIACLPTLALIAGLIFAQTLTLWLCAICLVSSSAIVSALFLLEYEAGLTIGEGK